MSAARTLEPPAADARLDDPETWRAVADRLARAGNWLPALTALGRAHRLAPGCLDDALKRTEFAWRAGTPDAELVRLAELAAAYPASSAPLAAQGVLLHRLGRSDEAAELLEAACALDPDNHRLSAILGGVLARNLQLPAAAAAMARALAADPGNHMLRHDYGVVLYRMHRFPQARRELLAVAEAIGDDPYLLSNLANTTLCMGLQDEARDVAERGVAASSGYLAMRTQANVLAYVPATTSAGLLAALRAASDVAPRPSEPPRFAARPDPDRRLRIGLLGGLLKTHPVGWLTIAGFENLDPAGFELVGIAETLPNDPLSRRFRAVARAWIEPAGKDDPTLAEAVRADAIDVLIDLGGYGDLGRMTACAWRPAPVQVKWVGMQNHSTGLPEMDWFITDGWETPPDLAAGYSERLLVLPDGYVCYSPPANAPPVTAPPMAARGHPTFGCFCNLAKVNPPVLDAWSAVLKALPDARFVLKSQPLSDPETADRLRAAFAARGVGPERIDLRGGSEHRAFLAEWSDIDIALDTFPYSGGLTTIEALWMGVPTITVPGEIFASRHSFSHMSNAGLGDWAAADVQAYVAQAVRRARDPDALAALRAGLRPQVRQSPLCDASRFGRNLGAALRHVWGDWCARPVNREQRNHP